VTSGATGSGNGTVTLNVAANTGGARSGTVTIGGQIFTVNQAAAQTCAVSINPTSQSVGAAGITGLSVSVTAPSGCSRPATSNATWITVTNGATGSGNGTVTLNVAVNAGAARTGTVTIGGQIFTVNQAAAAPACTYSINPTAMTVGDDGAKGLTVTISTGSGCQWTAAENVGWLDIKSAKSGTGSGSVTFDVGSHNSTRTGTLTIAGQTFTVTQAGCTYSINPTSVGVPAEGGSGNGFTVTAGPGCQWTAVSQVPWIILTNAQGSGDGAVQGTVEPNTTGAPRTGTVAVAGLTFTVNQQ
jgi:hypothetical protein